MSQAATPSLTWSTAHPKNWGMWLVIFFLFSISLLPSRVQYYLGKAIGKLAWVAMKSRVKVARRNLELCFPQRSTDEREQILRQNFDHVGHAVLDTANAWFWPAWRFQKHLKVEGLEHLEALREQGAGVLIISLHMLNLEAHARAFGNFWPGVGVYRPNKNPVYEYFQHKGRTRANKYLVDRTDVRGMIRALRKGEVVWYAPDHDYGHHAAVFAPFFAQEQAATITGTATLAKVKGVQPIISYAISEPLTKTYTLVIEAVQDQYPIGDELADASYSNQRIEQAILRAPEQYMWLHRRFKSRPPGESGLY